MTVKTITEDGRQLTVQTLQKVDPLGVTYWQGRAMFRIAHGAARADVAQFIDWYNTERPHSRLKYRPPLEFALGKGMKVRREWYGSGNLARLRGLCPQTPGIYRIRPPVQEGNREEVSRLP